MLNNFEIKNGAIIHRGNRIFVLNVNEENEELLPWKLSETHGVIEEGRGEHQITDTVFKYNMEKSIQKALSEKWGISPLESEKFKHANNRNPSALEIAEMTAFSDYMYLCRWGAGEIVYQTFTVREIINSIDDGVNWDSLSCIEFDTQKGYEDYHQESVENLLREVL